MVLRMLSVPEVACIWVDQDLQGGFPHLPTTASVRPRHRRIGAQPAMVLSDEEAMYGPLYAWLVATGRVDQSTRMARDVPWLGRWIDLSTLSTSGTATAYECKLNKTLDAIDQAAGNAYAYHRSWIVMAVRPKEQNLDLATQHNVGVLYLTGGHITILRDAPSCDPYPDVACRLAERIRTRGRAVPIRLKDSESPIVSHQRPV